MRTSAGLLEMRDAVNVKAKTGERIGHIGRAEAIGLPDGRIDRTRHYTPH